MTPERAANLLRLQIRFGVDTDDLKKAYRIGQAAIERYMVAKKPIEGIRLSNFRGVLFAEKQCHLNRANIVGIADSL